MVFVLQNKNIRTMKQLLILATTCFLFLTACKSTKKDAQTPMQFSEKIVNIELEMGEPLAKAEETLRAQADSGKFEEMGKTAEEAEKLIADRIDEIKKMSASDFKGGDEFKQASINYFQYIKSIYTNYKNIGLADNEGVRLAETRKMDTIRANQENVVTLMQAAQDKFATENGFKVETYEE